MKIENKEIMKKLKEAKEFCLKMSNYYRNYSWDLSGDFEYPAQMIDEVLDLIDEKGVEK